jgi:Domain of unknown function (DUF4153)
MNINMHDWLSRFHDFARGAWRKLPLESLAVATAALSSMAMVHRAPVSGALDTWLLRLLLGAVLAAPLCFALTWLHEHGVIRGRTRLGAGALVAAAVLGVLAFALPDLDAAERSSFVWPYGLSLLGAVLVPFVAVAVRAAEDRLAQFTVFLRRFFEQTTTWGLLWMGSMAALGVIFAALDELFDLDVDELGADVALAVTGVLVLSYLFRLLPAREAGARERMPELWRRLATTVGAPFVSVMLIILVIYEIVVIARGELPRNLLSPLIIGAGFVGFLCTLVIVSIQGEKVGSDTLAPADPHRWARRHSVRLARAFPPVLLVLLPMAAWALALRIEQHGFTPFRVARMMALLCLGTMSLLGTVRWLRGRMTLTWEVPLCVIVFAMATAFGPISAMRLSLASQVRRLEQAVAESKIPRSVADLPVPIAHQLDWEHFTELRDAIQVVADLGGEPALRRVLTGAVAHCTERWSGHSCLERLGVGVPSSTATSLHHTAQVQEPIPSPGGDLVFVELYQYAEHASGPHLMLSLHAVELYDGEREVAQGSLADLLAEWQTSRVLPPRPLALVRPDGTVAGHLAVHRLELYQPSENDLQVTRLYGAWLRPQPSSTPAP